MLFMARSLAVVISDGFPPSVPKDLPIEWLVGRVDMLRVSIFWLIGIAIICNYVLKKLTLETGYLPQEKINMLQKI